jgi:hypothetical protein
MTQEWRGTSWFEGAHSLLTSGVQRLYLVALKPTCAPVCVSWVYGIVTNHIHQKLSVWAKLQKQWETMESNLRVMKTRPAATAGKDTCPMEVELRALRAKVDKAFNDASAALYDAPRAERRSSSAAADDPPEHGR